MHTASRSWRGGRLTLLSAGLCAVFAAGLLSLTWTSARADDPKPPEAPKPPEKPAEAPAAPAEAPEAPEKAQDFTLKDLDGKERKLSEFAGKWVVLEWTNYTCPYVKKHYKVTPGVDGKPDTPGRMAQLQKTYTGKDVIWLSICSSAPGKEGNMSVAKWKESVKERQAAPTAVLIDEDGKVGQLYGAKKTPTIWVVDPKGFIAYFGAPDDAPAPTADPLTAKSYIAEFLDAVLAGKEPATRETPVYG